MSNSFPSRICKSTCKSASKPHHFPCQIACRFDGAETGRKRGGGERVMRWATFCFAGGAAGSLTSSTPPLICIFCVTRRLFSLSLSLSLSELFLASFAYICISSLSLSLSFPFCHPSARRSLHLISPPLSLPTRSTAIISGTFQSFYHEFNWIFIY